MGLGDVEAMVEIKDKGKREEKGVKCEEAESKGNPILVTELISPGLEHLDVSFGTLKHQHRN